MDAEEDEDMAALGTPLPEMADEEYVQLKKTRAFQQEQEVRDAKVRYLNPNGTSQRVRHLRAVLDSSTILSGTCFFIR